MADTKVSALAAATVPLIGDELVSIITTPSGTPTPKNVPARRLASMEVIAESVLAAAATSISWTSIPADFRHLVIEIQARSDKAAVAASSAFLRFNNDLAANYDFHWIGGTDAAAPSEATTSGATNGYPGDLPAATATASRPGVIRIEIPNYAKTTLQKLAIARNAYETGAGTGFTQANIATLWRSTAAINRVDISEGGGANFIIGSVFTLYGLYGTT